jgi:hypothetical protein
MTDCSARASHNGFCRATISSKGLLASILLFERNTVELYIKMSTDIPNDCIFQLRRLLLIEIPRVRTAERL